MVDSEERTEEKQLIEPGTVVAYTPSNDYWLSKDTNGNFCFEHYQVPAPGSKAEPKLYCFKPKSPNERMLPAKMLQPGKPLYDWHAKVLAARPDDTADLEVYHPGLVHRVFQTRVPKGNGTNSWHLSDKFTQLPKRIIVGSSPNLTTLGITFNPTISGTVGKVQNGADYKGPSQTASLSRSFAFTNSVGNTTALGADEFVSYLVNIPAAQGAVVDLTSLEDFLLQVGVSLARVKAFRLNLLSVAQDSSFGTAASQVTVNGPTPPPVQGSLTTSNTGGSIGAGTYNYVITALTAAGESTISNEKITTALSGSTNSVTLNWTAVPNATGYKIYRSTTPGTYTSPALITTIGSGSTVTYTDTAAATSTGAPPTNNLALTPNTFLFNSTNPYSDRILFNGDYLEWATSSANGLVVGGNKDIYIYNNDATHNANVQLTLVGGTT